MNKIMEVGVLSFGKVMGITGFLMGLLIGVIYGGVIIMFSLAGAQQGGAGMLAFGIGGGVAMMIFAPIFYGAFLFITGLIYALIINVVLRITGGLELRIE